MSPIVTVIVSIIAALGGIIVARLQRRTAQESNALEALRLLVSQQGDDLDQLQARVADLEERRDADREYIALLRDHIYRSKPPPPPRRP